MADTEISKLPPLSAAQLQNDDVLAIADISLSETKKIRADDLVSGTLADLPPGTVPGDAVDWDTVLDGSIDGSKIANRSIPAEKLELNTITANEIAPNAIGSSELANGAVDTAAILDDAVTAAKIADDAVGNNHIADGAVDTAQLADGAVTYDKTSFVANDIPGSTILDRSIENEKLVLNSITADEIAPNAIGSSELANNAVDTAAIADGAVTSAKIADGAVGTGELADGAVTYDKTNFADGDIPGSKIQDRSIENDKLVLNSITADEIAPNAIGSSELANNAVDTAAIADGAVTSTKIAADAVTETHLADASVGTSQLQDNSVTSDKIPADAIGTDELEPDLPGSIIVDGGIGTNQLAPFSVTTGKIATNAVTTDKIADGSVTDAKIAGVDGSKLTDNSVTGAKLSPTAFSGGIEKTNNQIVHSNSVAPGTTNGITFDAQGHITGTAPLTSSDLPIATSTSLGAVIVPNGSGLTVDPAGNLDHESSITASRFAGITYDAHGHITAVDISGQVPPSAIPIAGTVDTRIGGIYVPPQDNLQIGGDGALTHQETPNLAGTYTKVSVNNSGHVTSGQALAASDIPGIDASQVVSGQFGTNRIEDDAITAAKLGDYSTCLMQEDNPGNSSSYYLGMLWYQPSTAQLRVYARGSGPQNIWLPVGFGLLQQQNLRFAFTFDATTSLITSITQYGAPLGLAVGDPIPVANDANAGAYGVCVTAGTGVGLHDVAGANFTIGDWILSAGEVAGWQHINTIDGGGGGGGATFLNDLLDVTIPRPTLPLANGHILKYDSDVGQWFNAEDAAIAAVGDTPPTYAPDGALWWDSGSGRLFISYDDSDTVQWVPATPEISGGGGAGGGGGGNADLLNDLQDVTAAKTANAVLYYNGTNNRWESTTTIDAANFTIDGGSY